MYKNQLQELAQRSCFNLPSYTCIREGPDHAPRFKSIVNFNGDIFESPNYCSTLRQAEHAAAEVALNSLSNRRPSHSLAARILGCLGQLTRSSTNPFPGAVRGRHHNCYVPVGQDETGVYKNLLQEIAQRVGSPLPQYTTFRSGLGHQPIFTGMVELAGIIFTGEHAKNKKQAEKNAAMAAWTSLKQLAQEDASSSSETENNDELEQIKIARALLNYRRKEKMGMSDSSAPVTFEKKFPLQNPRPRPSSPQPRPVPTSRILPLICQKRVPQYRPSSATTNGASTGSPQPPQRFPAAGVSPYIPLRHCSTSYRGMAPPVTVRTAVPVFSAPPLPPPSMRPSQVVQHQPVQIAPPVCIKQAVPVQKEEPPARKGEQPVRKDGPPAVVAPAPQRESPDQVYELLGQLKI
ncbi:hypothetical protein RHMOL_Rhmol01G0294500 [Rhododendron molle]|uniref:Uncharacterized protein n=1 Tax=Rhododendron molle TaxID=49168 RepID=A0ACC0Q8B5_RHOML|nr:hypothetical protein RHMOL_Rhmol01G0294500 [Rhododendron molle]